MVVLITPRNRESFAPALDSVYRLRHRTFNEWLGWQLPHEDGRETDAFDAHAVHFVIFGNSGDAIACWRGTPTAGSYLSEQSFAELFGERPPPHREDVWDMSRFAVDRDISQRNNALSRQLMAQLYVGLMEFCSVYAITELLSVQSAFITKLANQYLGEPAWSGPTRDFGQCDATLHSYEPSLMRAHMVRAKYHLPHGPALEAFDVLGVQHAA